MINILNFYEAGKSRSGTALIPFFDTLKLLFAVSTRFGNLKLDYNDGVGGNFTTEKNRDYTDGNAINTFIQHNYASEFTGDIKVTALQGLKDVFSIAFSIFQDTNNLKTDKLNIQDFGTFIKQFPNLYSYHFNFYAYQTDARKAVIKGDLSAVPQSVERIRIGNFEVLNAPNGDAYFNFSSLGANSKLKYFLFEGAYTHIADSNIKFTGNIANLPQVCSFFKAVKATSNSAITYTAGKVWASAFDTLSIPLVLSHAELDNLLIDMDNSITTKIGAGVIALGGYRSLISDAAVASLQAKGFTVNVKSKNLISDSALFRMDFQNNYDVYSNSLIDITSGNGVGSTGNLPTFELSGRKAGEYCAVFNGSQSIKTTTNLPVNSDKVTVAFWMKTTQTIYGVIAELSANYNSNNAFLSSINDTSSNRLGVGDHTTSPNAYNVGNSSVNINNGNWFHVVITINRNLGSAQNQIYINGSLSYTQHATLLANLAGNFVNNILFIGQRAGSANGFNGMITRFRIENYPYTQTDVTNLYNSQL